MGWGRTLSLSLSLSSFSHHHPRRPHGHLPSALPPARPARVGDCGDGGGRGGGDDGGQLAFEEVDLEKEGGGREGR